MHAYRYQILVQLSYLKRIIVLFLITVGKLRDFYHCGYVENKSGHLMAITIASKH